jgi:hypothetical protein
MLLMRYVYTGIYLWSIMYTLVVIPDDKLM